MLRLAATLSLLVGSGLLLAYLTILGRGPFAGPEARQLRAMKDRHAAPARVERFGIEDFEALPHGRTLAEYAPIERRGVVMEGWVQRTLRAPDGDMHLEIVEAERAPGGPDTMYVTAEVTPKYSLDSRTWNYASLVAALRPNHGGSGPWPGGPVRARLTGWLLYDWQYDRIPSEWQRAHYAMRATGWEIHPVTKIELWDDARGAWRTLEP